ncbi:DNA alkylation repair protein [Patescibacteria group bacterium]|nr:DNA alkylation repair protein [Patescibacteria group bacterium]MBU1890672.1 DNA alkylation repair protein [Patescibacteria group bacterium]
MTLLKQVEKDLKKLANPQQVKILQRFFKTGPGEYGEGDIFLGIKVPVQRQVAKKYKVLSLADTIKLLQSKIHEHRMTALFILIFKYQEGDELGKKKIVDLYLKNTKYINNWDLVDVTAPKIIGDYLVDKPRNILYKLAKSKDLWEKRIAMISTYAFIRRNDFDDAMKIAKILLNEKHDLMHKVVGWMLREVGKRDQVVEENYLKKYYKTMPRTMLRYAIERFPESTRRQYLKK